MTTETGETVDLTPTWQGLLPGMLEVWRTSSNDYETRRLLRPEFIRMAMAADAYNRIVNSGLVDTDMLTAEGLLPDDEPYHKPTGYSHE